MDTDKTPEPSDFLLSGLGDDDMERWPELYAILVTLITFPFWFVKICAEVLRRDVSKRKK